MSLDNLWAWRAFLTVARTGSFSLAAEQLDRDKSTISRAIAGLEKSLGCQLFRQNTARPLLLSDAGKKAFRRMETLLRAHDQLIDDLRAEHRSIEGRIRLSTAQGFATRHLMPVLEKFRRIHPEVSVDILTGMSESDLARGLCDVAVFSGEPHHPGLVYTSRGRNVYLPVASPEYIQHYGLPLTPAQLSEHRGYLYTGPVREETKALVRAGSPTGESAPVAFGTTVRSTDVLAIREALLNGMGVAVDMPLVQIHEDLLANRLVPILPGWYRPPIECWVATTRDAWHARRVRVFFEWFAQEMRTLFAGYERAVAPIMGLPPDTEDRTQGATIHFTAEGGVRTRRRKDLFDESLKDELTTQPDSGE